MDSQLPENVRAAALQAVAPKGGAVAPEQTEEQKEAARLALVKQYEDRPLGDILTKPEYKDLRGKLDLGSAYTDYALKLADKSPITKTILAEKSLGDFIGPDGNYSENKLRVFTDAASKQAILAMPGETTLAAAEAVDPVIARYATPGLENDHYPEFEKFRQSITVGEAFKADGVPDEKNIGTALAKTIAPMPLKTFLGDTPGMTGTWLKLSASANTDEQTRMIFDGLSTIDNPFLKLPAAPKLTVGDILRDGPDMAVDPGKLKAISDTLNTQAQGHRQAAALGQSIAGATVFNYLIQQPDELTNLALTQDRDLLHTLSTSGGYAELPEASRTRMQQTKLAEVLKPDGSIDHDKLRDMVLEPVKDTKLTDLPPQFLNDTMPQLAAAVQQKPNSELVKNATAGMFLSKNDPGGFDAIQQRFMEATYPADERASKATAASNIWPQFQRGDTTVIPYSFDITSNTPLKNTTIQTENPTELTSSQKAMAEYAQWREKLGTKIDFEEVQKLPVKNGGPEGILLYNANLRSSDEEPSAEGVALNVPSNYSQHADKQHQLALNTPFQAATRIDDVIDPYAAGSISTRIHEDEHAFQGKTHDFDPQQIFRLPGRQDVSGTPGINENTTVMAYDPAFVTHDGKSLIVDQITPMAADYIASRKEFGTRRENVGDDTYTLKLGSKDDVIAGRDTHTLWVGKNEPFAQTVVDDGGNNTVDLSKINGGMPVFMKDNKAAFDLTKPDNIVSLSRADGMEYIPIDLSFLGKIQNVISTNGVLKGLSGEGRLELKSGGEISGGADQVGGTGNTVFHGDRAHTLRTEIRADAAHKDAADQMQGYAPGKDTIVAPAGTGSVAYNRTKEGALEIEFKDTNGDKLKSLSVTGEGGKALAPGDISIESTDGRKLSAQNAVSLNIPAPSEASPADISSYAPLATPQNLPKSAIGRSVAG